jgi:hypothetical protein
MNDRWAGNSDVFMFEPSRWPPAPVELPDEPDEPGEAEELSPRDRYKRKLSRAWMNSNSPKYWTEPPIDPVEQVTVPAAVNPAKGSGPVTAEEIAEFKANEREEFKRQLTERWRNNLMHL